MVSFVVVVVPAVVVDVIWERGFGTGGPSDCCWMDAISSNAFQIRVVSVISFVPRYNVVDEVVVVEMSIFPSVSAIVSVICLLYVNEGSWLVALQLSSLVRGLISRGDGFGMISIWVVEWHPGSKMRSDENEKC